ncbi:MAG: hypothetical protein ACREEM_40450 [Blastocatellia bacterium]
MTAITTASPQEVISTLPETAKRELAVWLLGHFDSNAILELLREVRPANEPIYDYEDPGPITDEELLRCAEARFLEYDREEAAHEKSSTR